MIRSLLLIFLVSFIASCNGPGEVFSMEEVETPTVETPEKEESDDDTPPKEEEKEEDPKETEDEVEVNLIGTWAINSVLKTKDGGVVSKRGRIFFIPDPDENYLVKRSASTINVCTASSGNTVCKDKTYVFFDWDDTKSLYTKSEYVRTLETVYAKEDIVIKLLVFNNALITEETIYHGVKVKTNLNRLSHGLLLEPGLLDSILVAHKKE